MPSVRAIGPVLPRSVALERGLPRYFTGLPCAHGHIAPRITSMEWCEECKREARRARNRTTEGKAERRASKGRRYHRRSAVDPLYRAVIAARTTTVGQLGRIRSGIKNSAPPSRHTQATLLQLKAHLEAQFQPGMTWGNYGEVWECDHIRPVSAWNLADPDQFRLCWSWHNLQPLTPQQNRDKNHRWGLADRLNWISRMRRANYTGPLHLRPRRQTDHQHPRQSHP